MAKKLKLSPWHDGSVKPVHVGWYEVEGDYIIVDHGSFAWRKWNGRQWRWDGVPHGFKACEDGLREAKLYHGYKWRGILKD